MRHRANGRKTTANIGLALPVHPLKKDPCGDKKKHVIGYAPQANNGNKIKSVTHGNKTMTTTTKQTSHSRMTDRARYRLPASTTVDPTTHGGIERGRPPIGLCTAADPATHDRLSEHTRWQSQASTVANLSTRHRFGRHSNKTRLARGQNDQAQQQNGKT